MKNSLMMYAVLALSSQGSALAEPDMSQAIGTHNRLLATVVPDRDISKNLYYIFPQGSSVVEKDGKQDFLYMENRQYKRRSFTVLGAQLSVGIKIHIDNPDLDAKMKEIKTINPNATFTVVTFVNPQVTVDESIKNVFLESSCNETAGPVEVPVYCTMIINPVMAFSFRHFLMQGPVRVLQYTYHFYGWANGKTELYTYTVPLTVGNLTERTYFVDQRGEGLKVN